MGGHLYDAFFGSSGKLAGYRTKCALWVANSLVPGQTGAYYFIEGEPNPKSWLGL
jgi:hypothetical protein